jgi:hypothetical protein
MFSDMENQVDKGRMLAAYHVPGFRACARIGSDENEPPAFVIRLDRRQKKRCVAHAVRAVGTSMTSAGVGRAISGAADEKFIWTSRYAA